MSPRSFNKLLGVCAALLLSFGGTAFAFTPSNFVSFTLEGCRNTGTVTLPNGDGKFICLDAAYTTGNLGKGWNELDLVPHRLTTDSGNQAGATTDYDVYIAGDNVTGGKVGWDVITIPVVNTAKSDASCSVSAGAQLTQGTAASPFGGGTDTVIYRQLTIHQAKNTTCVFDWVQRLALGAHLYPGSSLQSYMFDQQGLTGGKKTISIPVNEIKPQELAKDMAAVQNGDYAWSLTKTPTPANKSFGDVCAADAPTSVSVSVEIDWTRSALVPGQITVTTHVYATNPAARTITVNVTDIIYQGADQSTPIDTANSGNVDVPANTKLLILTHQKQVAAGPTSFNDVATATYTDKVTGIAVPGTTTATASASVTSGSATDVSAIITDSESITGTALTFSAADPGSSYGSFDTYVAGTPTTGPVDWTSVSQTGSGSVTFQKTIYLAGTTSTTGTLSDTAKLKAIDIDTAEASASIGITSDASVKFTLNKTIPNFIETGEKLEIFFDVTRSGDPSFKKTVTLTFLAGDTSKSTTVTGLVPDLYSVTEAGNKFYPSCAGCSPVDNVPLVDLTGTTKQVSPDLSLGTGGAVTCSGSVSFDNQVPDVNYAHAKVQKVTDPVLTSGDADYNWTFKLYDPNGDLVGTATAPADNTPLNFYDFGTPNPPLLLEGTYTVVETTKAGWDLNSATPNNGVDTKVCSFTVQYLDDVGKTMTCTFKNTKRGHAEVVKTVSGSPPAGGQTFTFQLRQGASTISDGTLLDTETANAANGGNLTFPSVAPGTYQMCEIVMPGWNTTLSNLPSLLFVPNSVIPPSLPNPSVNNMTVCVDFTVTAGGTKVFTVDNSPPPGGRALTIGFWKNWASCANSKGGQKPTLDVTLYNILPSGILVGDVLSVVNGQKSFFGQYPTSTADCTHAVELLDKSDFYGKKKASDPLYNMAAQLVAAELNVAAGAGVCPLVVQAISDANTLLSKYKFNGFGYTGKLSSTDATLANSLAKRLDDYNNNRAAACQ